LPVSRRAWSEAVRLILDSALSQPRPSRGPAVRVRGPGRGSHRGLAARPAVRRPARCHTDLPTSRYASAFDDRGARSARVATGFHSATGRTAQPPPGARDSHRQGAARPAAPISRQSAERHCRRFSGGLSLIRRRFMAADALGQAEAFHPGRHQCRRAGEPRSRVGNCITGPGGPPARAARTPGDQPRLLPAICRTRSGYRVTIVRLARLAALGTPANMAHIGSEQGEECAS
jgi:hypothetical protein